MSTINLDLWLFLQQDSDSGELDLVSKDEDEAKLRHLSANNAVNKKRKKKEEVSSSDSE